MSEASSDSRRQYDSSNRQAQAARTRERIVDAASELVHDFASWNWAELTFRAVAARAGVGERTVYRHLPTERHLHDAVMARLEADAGITYEDVTLTNLADVTSRVFGSLQRFSVGESVNAPQDATFAEVDRRRRDALLRAVTGAAPQWTAAQQQAAAGLLDVLWNLPTYERLVGTWKLPESDATQAVSWLLDLVAARITTGDPPVGIA